MFIILKKIFSQKFYRKIFFILNIIFLLLYFLFINFVSAFQIFFIPFFNNNEKVNIFLSSLFDISSFQNFTMLVSVILFIFSISLLFILFYVLFNESKKISKKKSIFGMIGIFLSVLGFSCLSCGIGLLASIFSLFGLSSLSLYFPLHGLEFGFLGIVMINITNFFLLKRIKNPFIC
ncbi:MAG: hypothetical protein KBD12_02615 [Candidatus Pacebacteria bacterium]|nr:hypothetical protein [Candidatus Paceibacterota bacterium]